MGDLLEELLSSEVVTEERVLELVDEYNMYSFYLQYPPELRTSYNSPFRVDQRKSFSLFSATKAGVCEFLWKDSGNGLVGNIFLLVRILFDLDGKQATLRKIDQDFELGLFPDNLPPLQVSKPLTYTRPKDKGPCVLTTHTIPWTPRGLQYWKDYGVGRDLLDLYLIKEFSHYWTSPEQVDPYTPRGLAFQYEIGDRKKLYQPHNKECKFLNSYEPWMVEGWLQLPPGELDTLVISKSTKDIACLRAHGVFAVGPRSESTPILPQQLDLIRGKARRVLVWFDQDWNKEVNIGQVLAQQYDFPNICIPSHYQLKDPSDFRKAKGEGEFRQLLNHLLQ